MAKMTGVTEVISEEIIEEEKYSKEPVRKGTMVIFYGAPFTG